MSIENINECINANSLENENKQNMKENIKYTFPKTINKYFPEEINTKEKREMVILKLLEKYKAEIGNLL